jgi:hypothetical protein
MPSEDRGFLVRVYVTIAGGREILTAVDAFRAETEEEARNYAFNMFTTGVGATMYGDTMFILDAVGAVRAVIEEKIDLADPDNAKWLNSVDLFERFLEKQDARQESDRPFPPPAGTGPR